MPGRSRVNPLEESLIPPCPEGSTVGAAQMNDVYVDENGLIYAIERFKGGLYILEGTF